MIYVILRITIVILSFSLVGCSTHPLPRDVTGFSVADLIYKIRCEAAANVWRIYLREGHADIRREFDIDQKKLSALKQKKGKIRTLDDINQDIDLVESSRQFIIRRATELLIYEKNNPNIDLSPEKIRLRAELEKIDKKTQDLKGELKNLEKIDVDISTINDEFKTKYKLIYEFKQTAVASNYRFKITETDDLSSKGSVGWPVNIGTLTIGWDVADKKQRLSERSVKLADTFWELLELPCDNAELQQNFSYPVAGDIGLLEVFDEYSKLREGANFSKAAKGEAYSDTIQFTTTVSGSVNPSLTLVGIKDHSLTAGATAGVKREDIHEVIIYLALPGGDVNSDASRMIITKAPTINVRVIPDGLGSPPPFGGLPQR